MTARPWMPLYVGDYLADTGHLNATQHGAYLLLLMHCWQHGSIPIDDDEKLSRIVRIDIGNWRRHCKGPILEFFDVGGGHSRIDREITKAKEISNKRKEAALQMHERRRANAEQKHTQPQSQLQRKKDAAPNGAQSVSRETTFLFESPPTTNTESAEPKQTTEEASLFSRGKEVLGTNAGGMIARLLKAKKGNVPLARAAIELAATKQAPREYIGAVIAGGVASIDGKRMTADEAYWGGKTPGII